MWFEIRFMSQATPSRTFVLDFECVENAIVFADKNIREGEFYKITELENHPCKINTIEDYINKLK